jgi:hypothetical protein
MFGIIAFWLVMMGLLVRLETHPEGTDILDVPVSYVERIMFKHGQQSLLTAYEADKPIGTISLRPSVTGSDGRLIDFSGALSMQMPLTAARQRFNFDGAMDLDIGLRMLDFHVELNLQSPHYHLTAKGDVPHKVLTYEIHEGNQLVTSQMLPMDAAGLGPALAQDLGLPANALPVIAPGSISPPSVTAREAHITLHGEQLQVYQVTIREGASPVADIYVTQLGQIILATTNFGYTLSAEGYQ